MVQYGFVIDQRRCIGCHACTVACKSENDVPLGDYRTWVKYTEKGTFPDVKRHFTVLRCNHCDAAPCVEICPVFALHKRPDAIVDLDRDLCIGCRACMQACPYDALYLNEATGVAEKCHYCAHRTEMGLEPACVVVCPEQAIVAGDTERPDTRIATLIREEKTSQRKVDKGTQPRVWYVDALPESLTPGAAREPDSWLWADRREAPAPTPSGFEPPRDLVTTLDVSHPPVWGWHIWTYLVTKNVAAGAMMVAPFLGALGVAPGWAHDWLPEIVGLFFWAVTNVLLVHDLGRPERFLNLVLKGNPKSWLVKGAWVLGAYAALAVTSLVLRASGMADAADVVRWVTVPVAALVSGYSAWLFAQCKGRDLWTESGLFWQLLLRAALLGVAFAMLLPQTPGTYWSETAFIWLAVAVAIGLYLERVRTRDPKLRRAKAILRTSLKAQEAVTLLLVAAVIVHVERWIPDLTSAGRYALSGAGALLALVSLFLYERSWIRAGQAVPIS